ncbi:MAG: winged helix-turn-helix domain-containing protein [Candidatus Omnitrophica bacterium]|nr:winged helix-turn-helix domain-containing protein [Candidatus Omnitrophota bacterium]
MQQQYYAIGDAAGKIYKTLEQQGKRSLTQLQKESGISDPALVNQAIGWLARENKIAFDKIGRGSKVSLV